MAKGADVEYTLRADDSELEKDLNEAEKKIEKSAKSTSDSSSNIEKNTGKTKKKVKEDVTEHHKQQNKEQEKSDEESAEKREDIAKKHGEKLKGFASGTTKAVGAGMLATGTAIVGMSVSAVNSANNLDKALNQYIASTGKGTEESERYKKVMEEIYTDNYGESFEDIGDAMSKVTQNLGDLNDADLSNITESAFALRDTFEYDIAESTRAARTLMDQFGISGDKAMNLITAGAQNGLDFSGELLDSINEYSVHFSKVGLDADDMFKIFEKGAESGAFNLDKVGDAVKEMSIRVIDGSDSTKEGFAKIGLNADEMASKFAKGGDSAKEAFQQTIDALAKLKDPLEQDAAGVALFGTMWEDLGADAVTALADIEDGAYSTGEELDKLKEIKYNDLSSVFEGLMRSIEILIIPLGEKLIPLLTDVIEDILPVIEEMLPVIMECIEELLPPFMEIIETIMPTLVDLISTLSPMLGDIIDAVLPVLTELLQLLLPPIMDIVEKALPPLVKLFESLMPILSTIIDLLTPIIELFFNLLQPIIDVIDQALVPLIDAIQPVIDILTQSLIPIIESIGGIFKTQFEGAFKTVKDVITNITNAFKGIVDFINNVFKGNWKGAWEAVSTIFKNVVDGLINIFKIPLNWIIDGINGFINGLNCLKIPDWVPGVGGFGINIPTIPRLKVGMDYVPSDYYPAYLDEGEAVLTKQENAMYRQLGGLQGMYTLFNSQNDTTSIEVPDIDYKRIGSETAKAIEGMGIFMDGETVGEITAQSVNNTLGKITRRRT